MDTMASFWNSKKVVGEFKGADVQAYWVEFFSEISKKEDKIVLDLGCGGGRYTEMLAKMGFAVCAFDRHEKMVESTKARLQLLDNLTTAPVVLQAKMAENPFEDGQFDYIIANGVFHNAENLLELKQTLAQAARVLKSGGSLCLNMFYDGGNNTFVTKESDEYMFVTRDELPMILVPLPDLLEVLVESGFVLASEVITYSRKMEVGVRDVMRCVLVKA